MWLAISYLKSHEPDHWLFCARSAQKKPVSKSTSIGIAEQILADIRQGELGQNGVIAPRKYLAARYGVCFRTIKTALAVLEAQRHLVLKGKHFHLPHRAQPASSSCILLVGLTTAITESSIDSLRGQRLIHYLRHECSLHGLGTISYPLSFKGRIVQQPPHMDLHSLMANPRLLGVIFFWSGLNRYCCNDFLQVLGNSRHPLVILDDSGAFDRKHIVYPRHRTTVFRLGLDGSDAQAVAEFLYKRGHRRVAYLSAHHEHEWSQQRMTQLANCARNYGDMKIIPFIHSFKPWSLRINELAQWDKKMRKFLEPGLVATDPDVVHTVRMLESMLPEVQRRLWAQRETAEVEALSDKMLYDKGISAFVGANDSTVVNTLTLHAATRKLEPVGFDNDPCAESCSFSSYDYRLSTLAHTMVSQLLNQHITTRVAPAIDGFVVERKGPFVPAVEIQ